MKSFSAAGGDLCLLIRQGCFHINSPARDELWDAGDNFNVLCAENKTRMCEKINCSSDM